MSTMPTQAPTLSDGTVTLRAHRDDDVQRMWEQCQDPESIQWTTVPVPYSHADAADFVRFNADAWRAGREWGFAVEYAGRYGGTVALRPEAPERAELAYGSHPDVRGTGAMERACRLLLAWGFDDRGLATVSWWADVGNWASRKLAWRVGFQFGGTVRGYLPHRGEMRDAWVGTLLRDDRREPLTPWLDKRTTVTSERVVLRPFRDDDVPRIVEACRDAETQRWFGGFPSPYEPEHALGWLHATRESDKVLRFAIADPRSDLLLGQVSIFDLRPSGDGEIGYWLHPDARGRGLMIEAVAVVIGYAFETLRLMKLKGAAAVDNAASRAVLEKAGMRYWGTERLGTRVRTGLADLAWYDLTPADLD